MAEIDSNEFIEELKFCLDQKDIVKTRALLQFAKHATIPLSIQKKALEEIAQASHDMRLHLLDYLTRLDIPHPDIRNRLTSLIRENISGNEELFIRYLTGSNKKNRLIYITIAGETKLEQAAPFLETMLEKIRDGETILQVVKALGKLRRTSSFPALLNIIHRIDNNSIRNTAALAIADTGGKKAADCLASGITGKTSVDLILIKALAGMNEVYAMNRLNSLLGTSNVSIRKLVADQVLKKAEDIILAPHRTLQDINEKNRYDQTIKIIRLLGQIDPSSSLPLLLEILKSPVASPQIKRTVFNVMEKMPCSTHFDYLAEGLKDPSKSVRIGAARVVDKIFSKKHLPMLKDLVKAGDQTALNAVGALIDAGAEKIPACLIDEDSFVKLAVHHMAKKASPAVQNNFYLFLKKKNFFDLLSRITPDSSGTIQLHCKKKIKLYVVDDSLMMQKLLRKKLKAMGYRPSFFHSHEEAVYLAFDSKPDLMIIDWHMPHINGIHLAAIIRDKYVEKELPIIMIIPQKDFRPTVPEDLFFLNASLMAQAGISKTLQKPFTDEMLQGVVSYLLDRIH